MHNRHPETIASRIMLLKHLSQLAGRMAAYIFECDRRLTALEMKYDPNQPRVPAGSSDGGEWTDGGSSTVTGRPVTRVGTSRAETVTEKPKKTYPPIPKRPDGKLPVNQKGWEIFHDNLDKGPKISATEQDIYAKIFAFEGGFKGDNATMAGITPNTLTAAKENAELQEMLKDVQDGDDIKSRPDLVAWIYKGYFDTSFKRIGGSAALAKIGDVYAAGALADTVFREGTYGGAKIVLKAVNKTLQDYKQPTIDVTMDKGEELVVGPRIISAYVSLVGDPVTLPKLLGNLADMRVEYNKRRPDRSLEP